MGPSKLYNQVIDDINQLLVLDYEVIDEKYIEAYPLPPGFEFDASRRRELVFRADIDPVLLRIHVRAYVPYVNPNNNLPKYTSLR